MSPKVQILIPGDLRETVQKECHASLTARHLGRRKTLSNMKKRFLWIGMRRDVKIYVKTCTVCQQFKSQGQSRKAALKDYRKEESLEWVCFDLAGPFPVSGRGNRYALVMTDCFTKYVEIYALPNPEAKTVAQMLTREFFSRYGVPLELHSDQGIQFESKLFQEICELLGIHKTRTTPFRPQSDKQSERNIRTLIKLIAMVVDKQEEWAVHLLFIAMVYLATPYESKGSLQTLWCMDGSWACLSMLCCLQFAYEMAWVALKSTSEKQTWL